MVNYFRNLAVPFALTLALLPWAFLAGLTPDRPMPKKPPARPSLDIESIWGAIQTDAKGNVNITGCPAWTATGKFVLVGQRWELRLMWVAQPSGRLAPGLYFLDDDMWRGHWAYRDDCTENEDGTFSGMTSRDALAKVAER